MRDMTDMAVVIVNHNTRDQLRACLDSIQYDAQREVIVVDNASCDGSVEMVRTDYHWVTLVANQMNPGYGAGANQGIARSNAEYVLLLNSDTRLEPGALGALEHYLDQHTPVAIVGPRLANIDGTLQASCYPFPTPGNVFLEESGFGRWIRLVPFLRGTYLRTWSHNRARSVPWVLGAALAIRREAFEEVNGFSELFFMYYEEVDLCYRLRGAGWQVHFAPVTTVTHVGGASTKQRRVEMIVQVYASLKQFYRRHYSRLQRILLNLVIKAVVLGRLIRDSAQIRSSTDRSPYTSVAENLIGWRRVLAGERAVSDRKAEGVIEKERLRGVRQPQLRRADWRFLLPTPPAGTFEHLVLLGGTDGLAKRLVEAGIARQVSRTIPDQRSADALVILGGDFSLSRLRHAVSSLMPDGVFYCEIDRRWSLQRLTATPASMQRILHGLSLSSIGVYWAAPSLTLPNKYIPLDVPGAMRWYLTTLCVAGTPLQRLVERGVNALAAFGSHWVALLLPWYAITAIAEPGSSRLPSVLGHASSPIGQRRSNVRPIILTSGQDDGSRVVFLPFTTDSRQPECVIKVARLPEFNTNVEHEQRILAEIRTRLDTSMSRSIPQPFGLFHLGELAVGTESCAPGRSLFISSGRWRVSNHERVDDLRLATRWLARFNRQTQISPPESGASEFARRADRLFDRYSRAFDVTPNEMQLFATVLIRARELIDAPLPIVWQHNDFGPWNLFRANDELHVIDWELGWGPGFDHAGPAMCDLLYFVTHWSFAARQLRTEAAWLRGFHQLFIGRDRHDDLIAAAHRAIDEYLLDLGIDRRFLPLVLVYTWVERALKRLDRRRILGDLTLSNRSGDKFVTYVSHLADHTNEFLTTSARCDEFVRQPERSGSGLPDVSSFDQCLRNL
jgi:GT2 family glycosyltransferase